MKEWFSLRCVRGVLYDLEENHIQTQILSHFLLISARDLQRELSRAEMQLECCFCAGLGMFSHRSMQENTWENEQNMWGNEQENTWENEQENKQENMWENKQENMWENEQENIFDPSARYSQRSLFPALVIPSARYSQSCSINPGFRFTAECYPEDMRTRVESMSVFQHLVIMALHESCAAATGHGLGP
ncbi:uncharacterized [Tachysurus ichikawai]